MCKVIDLMARRRDREATRPRAGRNAPHHGLTRIGVISGEIVRKLRE